jgi:hypothetical protein
MRKAFDANVPKLRPRLKTGAPGAAPDRNGVAAAAEEAAEVSAGMQAALEEEPLPAAELTDPVEADIPAPLEAAPSVSRGHDERTVGSARAQEERPAVGFARTPQEPPAVGSRAQDERPVFRSARPEPVEGRAGVREADAESRDDVLSRRDRLERIKRRVADAARPAPRFDPVPTDPARAAESVLGLVRDLEVELVRAREREDALRGDLDQARSELARTAGEARASAERLVSAEAELADKRGVLTELLGEMTALEDERDEALRRAQAMAALDEERAKLLEEVTRKADEEGRLRAEREEEVERLSEELRAGSTEGARLRTAIGELARERDQLAGELDRLRRERDELAAAKRALEQVHAALAQARARLG